jgi:hypothetical protein
MTTKLADNAVTEQAKKALAEDRKISDRSRAEYAERSKGKPTPTQEENDLAALGGHILEHEDDGSGPDPFNKGMEERQIEADKPHARPQNYATRQSHPRSE